MADFAAWAAYSLVYLLLLNGKRAVRSRLILEQDLLALYLAGAAAGYWGMV